MVALWSLQLHGGLSSCMVVAAWLQQLLWLLGPFSHWSQVGKNLFIKLLSINVPDLMDQTNFGGVLVGRNDSLLDCKERSLGLLGQSLGLLGQSVGSQGSLMGRSHYCPFRGIISCIFKNTIPYLGNRLFAVSLKLHLDIVSSKLWSQGGLKVVS